MTIRSRLRRVLGGQSRFRKKVDHVPDAEISSASSGLISQDDDEYTIDSGSDPYADVRDHMDGRAERDRARYAFHTDDNANAPQHEEIVIPAFTAYTVYLGYAMMIIWGHIRDFFAFLFQHGRYIRQESGLPSDNLHRFAPLLKSWEHFYTRRLYTRVQDAFNRPISSNPGSHIDVLERVSADGQKSLDVLGSLANLDTDHQRKMYLQGKHFVQSPDGSAARRCINMGSYNYLGFADDWMSTCGEDVIGSLDDMPISHASSRMEYGTSVLHKELENTVAEFLGKEDAVCFNMGFNTNATTIPALLARGDLCISDELNHTSIVNGARASGAAIRIFRHNDSKHLEEILREAIILGRPRTRRPWNKIFVIVEGIYSMEGEYCDLRNVVRICKKYGAYVYLDEAHSIGAMGATGRGVAEYCGVDTADIDIMMGTFTKSFGGMGGYIAANKDTIDFLRQRCAASINHNSLSPVVCQQCLSAFNIIMGKDGTNIGKQKLQALRDNANYFRMRLQDMGLQVLGRYDSPVMPIMLYNPTKISAFSRECFKRGVAVVVVGFPACPILLSRARFCVSAGHTRHDLDQALKEIEEVADIIKIRYARSTFG
jgi:serine palmitoyltransferase